MSEISYKRNNTLDILKGIGIIFMIMNHSNMGSIFTLYVGGFHMQLFFFISGMLFNPNKYNKLQDYAKRKTKTIIIPYFTFAALTIAICIFVNLITGAEKYSYYDMAKGIIWSNNALFPITGAIWFLQCTFVIEISAWFLCKKFGEKRIPIIILIFLIIGYICYLNNVELPFSSDSAITGIAIYFSGYLISCYLSNFLKKIDLKLSILFLTISLLLILFNGPVNPRTCMYGIYMLYFLNAFIAFLGWYGVAKYFNDNDLFSKLGCFIKKIGRNSILYLGLNQLLIAGLYTLFNIIFTKKILILQAIRNILISIFTIIIIYIINKKIKGTKVDILLGRR